MMNKKVLIIGGTGNFGKRISIGLIKRDINIGISSRNSATLDRVYHELISTYKDAEVSKHIINLSENYKGVISDIKPHIIINASGPFQNQNYELPDFCVDNHIHYIDLADDRSFVKNISSLNEKAINNKICVISGASTVPTLSSAVLNNYLPMFKEIETLRYGISPGGRTKRGDATIASILSYVGSKIDASAYKHKAHFGWFDLHTQKYPELGNRLMSNCDVPDLDLFPAIYAIKDMQFSAGLESSVLHLGLWMLACIRRFAFNLNLKKHTAFFKLISHFFDVFCTEDGGMHVCLNGTNKQGKTLSVSWFIIAKHNTGPQIPCIPSILLTEKILNNTHQEYGAYPAVGLLQLSEYTTALEEHGITQIENISN